MAYLVNAVSNVMFASRGGSHLGVTGTKVLFREEGSGVGPPRYMHGLVGCEFQGACKAV